MKFKIFSFLKRSSKIEVFEKLAEKTENFKFLTPQYVAELDGISVDKARRKLTDATKHGFMEKRYLFSNIDPHINIFIEENQINTTLQVEDFSISEEPVELNIHPDQVREVYVCS